MKFWLVVIACFLTFPSWATEPAPPPKKRPPIYVQEVWQQQKQKQKQKQHQDQRQSVVISNGRGRPAAIAPSLSLTAHSCIGSVNGVIGVAGAVSGGVGWTRVHNDACAMEWALKCLAFERLRGKTWVNRCIDRALMQAEWSGELADPRIRRAMKEFDDAGKVRD